MVAINSIEQLESYRQEIAAEVKADLPTVLVCFGTGCQANGARLVAGAFSDIIEEQGLELNVNIGIKTTGCHGYCENGPLVALQPKGILYLKVKPEDVAEIVIFILTRPRNQRILETAIRPMTEASWG